MASSRATVEDGLMAECEFVEGNVQDTVVSKDYAIWLVDVFLKDLFKTKINFYYDEIGSI